MVIFCTSFYTFFAAFFAVLFQILVFFIALRSLLFALSSSILALSSQLLALRSRSWFIVHSTAGADLGQTLCYWTVPAPGALSVTGGRFYPIVS
jgi:hypothetical protein